MRKIIFVLVIIVLILSVMAAWTMLNKNLSRYSLSLAQTMIAGKTVKGVTVHHINIGHAQAQFPDTLVWKKIEVILEASNKTGVSNQRFKATIPQLNIQISDFFENLFILSVPRIDITSAPGQPDRQIASEQIRFHRLEKGRFEMRFKFDFFHPFTAKDQVTSLMYNVASLFSDGNTAIPVNFSGILHFEMIDDTVLARIYTKHRSDGYYALQINEEFFQTMAWYNTLNMTDAEARLLSENPFRMPQLIRIMDEAKNESQRAANARTVPEDAYRHVLWSYLLTQAYGPDFAKQVTDAHEIGDSTNTEADHQMDYNNNAIGRQYALDNVKKHEILRRLLNDKNVIRKAQ